jgi:hypothetical protein
MEIVNPVIIKENSKSKSRSKPSSENLISRSGSRTEHLRTFIVSVPIGSKIPKIKQGIIKELDQNHTIDEIEKLILESEVVAYNLADVAVQTAKCCGNVFKLVNKIVK